MAFLLSFLLSSMGLAQEIYLSPNSVYEPYGQTEGFLQFRGNPTHTFYGEGPVPENPEILWRYPESPISGPSSVGGEVRTWTGTGWTGQPVVWPNPTSDGWEVIFGAYDHDLHFVDWQRGESTRRPFATRDIIKGTPTIDPDGFPLVYFGSRDNYYRILALDRGEAVELWRLDGQSRPGRVWNNDWDGNASIVNDYLIVGGENSLFYIIKLNRAYDEDGFVTVHPEIVLEMPGYNNELFSLIGDRNVSIENSPAVFETRVYFANSGGRVVGIDTTRLETYESFEELIVFDYWVGDDTDASLIIDEEGMLYAAVQKERSGWASRERQELLGQLVKLNPYVAPEENPVVWESPAISLSGSGGNYSGGIWATPALYNDHLYVPTHNGPLYIVNKNSGQVVWETQLGYHSWSSPLVVDNQLIVANCSGQLFRYDVSTPSSPELQWQFQIPSGGCIESTPLLWQGRLIFGSRDGFVYAVGDDR
jgi:outer membrane protein assembly factor BamB